MLSLNDPFNASATCLAVPLQNYLAKASPESNPKCGLLGKNGMRPLCFYSMRHFAIYTDNRTIGTWSGLWSISANAAGHMGATSCSANKPLVGGRSSGFCRLTRLAIPVAPGALILHSAFFSIEPIFLLFVLVRHSSRTKSMASVLHYAGCHLYYQYRGKACLVLPGIEDQVGFFH